MMKTATALGLFLLAAITPLHAGEGKTDHRGADAGDAGRLPREHVPRTKSVTVQPTVTGTLRYLPYFDSLSQYGEDLHSVCMQFTEQSLEWRRAFIEFDLPVDPAHIAAATLHLTELNFGWSDNPAPTDVHEVSLYPGDLVVDTSDFDVPTLLVGTLESDPNDDPVTRVLEFDVTQAIRQMAKRIVGVRIKLQIDPNTRCILGAGSDFGSLYYHAPTLQLVVQKGKKRGQL